MPSPYYAAAWAAIVTPTQRLVLLALAQLADQHGRVQASIETIQQATGFGERATYQALRDLVVKKYLTTERPGFGLASVYDITEINDDHNMYCVARRATMSGTKCHNEWHDVPQCSAILAPSATHDSGTDLAVSQAQTFPTVVLKDLKPLLKELNDNNTFERLGGLGERSSLAEQGQIDTSPMFVECGPKSTSPPTKQPTLFDPEVAAVAKPKPKRKGSRLADDWIMPEDWIAWAVESGKLNRAQAETEAQKFTNHWKAKAGADASKMNWKATWHNWFLTAAEGPGRFHKKRQPETKHDLPTGEYKF